MRIAVDVMGTIEGPKQKYVLRLIRELQDQGHEIVVWSNSYGYAVDAVNKHALKAEAWPKRMKSDYDYDTNEYFDLAIDDDSSQDWLAAKRFIWVHNLPSTMEEILKLVQEIGGNYGTSAIDS